MLLSLSDPIFLLIVSAVTQRPHIFWWNVGSSIALKTPYFFAFGCHRKLLFVPISSTNWSFLPFSTIFFFKFLLLKRSLKDQNKHFHPMPLILNQNLASHTMTPHVLRLCSHRMPQPLEVWALHPYPFDIGVPPDKNKNKTKQNKQKRKRREKHNQIIKLGILTTARVSIPPIHAVTPTICSESATVVTHLTTVWKMNVSESLDSSTWTLWHLYWGAFL